MGTFGRMPFPIEMVSCSDVWQIAWWQMMGVMLGLAVFSIPQCKQNRQASTWPQAFEAIGQFARTFIEADKACNMSCYLTLLKSQIQSRSILEDIITSSNTGFDDLESAIVGGIWKRGNWNWESVKNYLIAMSKAGSWILTLELQARKKSDLWDIACIVVKMYTKT